MDCSGALLLVVDEGALELGVPTSAEVKASDKKTDDCPALWNIIEMNYAARGNRPPVKMIFYDGGLCLL